MKRFISHTVYRVPGDIFKAKSLLSKESTPRIDYAFFRIVPPPIEISGTGHQINHLQMKIKLQEYLKRHGYANSNKNAKRLIRDHTVKVNGVKVKSCCLMVGSEKCSAVQIITSTVAKDEGVADAALATPQSSCPTATTPIQPFCIVYCKPCGMVCTKSTSEKFCLNQIEPPIPENYHPVGRLDQHSHGLLLFSLDGRLTSALLSPNTAVERVYRIIVRGDVGTKKMKAGTGCDGITGEMISEQESSGMRYEEICKLVENGVETDYGYFKGRILQMQRNIDGDYEHSNCVFTGGRRNDTFDDEKASSRDEVMNKRCDDQHEKSVRSNSGESETCILSSITISVKEGKKRMVRRLFAAMGLFVLGK